MDGVRASRLDHAVETFDCDLDYGEAAAILSGTKSVVHGMIRDRPDRNGLFVRPPSGVSARARRPTPLERSICPGWHGCEALRCRPARCAPRTLTEGYDDCLWRSTHEARKPTPTSSASRWPRAICAVQLTRTTKPPDTTNTSLTLVEPLCQAALASSAPNWRSNSWLSSPRLRRWA